MKRTLALALLVLPLIVGASLEAGAQGAAPSAVPARPHLPDADGAPQGDVPAGRQQGPSQRPRGDDAGRERQSPHQGDGGCQFQDRKLELIV